MAKAPSPAVQKFMAAFKVDSDEIWEVHGTTWVVKHKALERVAAEQGITFDRPELSLCDLTQGFVVVLVSGKLKERVEFSFGEASPKNNKNSYPVAMAEKRAKDRVILKLLAAHGDLYSEEEADDFREGAKRQNPHVNHAQDFHTDFADESDIPTVDATKMKVKDARPAYEAMVKEMRRITDMVELGEWGKAKAQEINSMPGEWPLHFRAAFKDHKNSLMNGQAA
jgi:hypothetical protein